MTLFLLEYIKNYTLESYSINVILATSDFPSPEFVTTQSIHLQQTALLSSTELPGGTTAKKCGVSWHCLWIYPCIIWCGGTLVKGLTLSKFMFQLLSFGQHFHMNQEDTSLLPPQPGEIIPVSHPSHRCVGTA